ncbi:hypothetical protein EV359DRAFT_67145 [Lentinula novae-zelandiae]|nr:hypothetical protein EV359DRAFT_67145 [Lentinula novae-zelandiae]
MPDLPQELIDRFIDESFRSTEDLKNISLVSKSWLPRTRYYIFRCITLAPRDPQEISEYYDYLDRKASAIRSGRSYHPLSFTERRLLHSPLFGNLQPQKVFMSSIRDTLHLVRGLRLQSFIRIGGERRISPEEYFHRWLGFGGHKSAEESILMRGLSIDDEFHERQKARWNAVDLPWGHRAGLHALSFRSLRFIHIQWSVFSWIPPSVALEGDDFPVHVDLDEWPGYQLAMLLKANENTLDQISIDEYPGFQLTTTQISDALLDLLMVNVPKLKSVCLGGLMQRMNTFLVPEALFDLSQPEDPEALVSLDRPRYPSGREVPHVYSNLASTRSNKSDGQPLSLDRFSVRGFASESTLLIEDAFLNSGVLSAMKYLTLSSMPENFDYMFFLSRLCRTLTHLTLDLDKSTRHLNLQFHLLPNLTCLQFMIHSIVDEDILRNMILSLLNDGASELDEPITAARTVKLHLAFCHEHHPDHVKQYLIAASVDELLQMLILPTSFEPHQPMRTPRVDQITMDLPVNILSDSLPITFRTGNLNFGETDEWWYRPSNL